MKCPECQTENEEGRRFCGQCGAKLGWKCPTCGFVNGPQDRFCGGCGERLGEAPAMGKIPHTPEAMGKIPHTPEAMGKIPHTPEEMGKIPHTPVVVPPKLEDMHTQLQSYIPKSLSDKIYAAGQEAKGENRLVTTLFADISGFTPASEQISPEQVADLVNNCFKVLVDIICRYEGSINRFIGDCVLAFFGAPIAHENDPERAIRAALEMCEEITKLNRDISVGINTGMMYVGTIGTDLYMEYTAEGHAVNLAKRLQETAEPGQILVGDATHKFTRRMFDFEPLEPLILRGIRQPVRAYSVLKVAERPEKLRGIEGLRARLVGRDREFEMLTDCADALIDGRGQIVSIIGEAGIGKSRLASELKGYIKDKDVRWLEGRCISIGQSISYWPFLDILRTYLDMPSSTL
jgi:class 3 adenylate cyclase